MKRFKTLIVGLLIILVPSAIAVQPGKYNVESIRIMDKVCDVLIANGYCHYVIDTRSKREKEILLKIDKGYLPRTSTCIEKHIAFSTGSGEGIYADFFQISKQEVINQILKIYTTEYFKHNQEISIFVNFNRHSFAENRWYKKSYIQLKLKGIEK